MLMYFKVEVESLMACLREIIRKVRTKKMGCLSITSYFATSSQRPRFIWALDECTCFALS